MSMQAGRTKLVASTKELMLEWERTRQHWRDARSEEFERMYLSGLLPAVERAAGATGELGNVLARIRHECE